MLQEAQKAGLANDPNVKIAVQNATNNIMTEALLNRYVQQHPTSDADLQKMYQKDKAAYGNTEYHLRQIVTKTQGEAQNALNRVLKGENFAKVASAVTIDQPSKAQFAALDMKYPGNISYSYKLEGFENNWNNIGNQRTATYTNLPKGHYTLKVRSTNSDGIWVENTRTLDINILPSFWETPWAYSLYVLFILLVIFTATYILFKIGRAHV